MRLSAILRRIQTHTILYWQSHTVTHLRALISGNLEPRGQGCGCTFMFSHPLLKKAILLHKEAYHANVNLPECM